MSRHKNRRRARNASEYAKLLDIYTRSADNVINTDSAVALLDDFDEIMGCEHVFEADYVKMISNAKDRIIETTWTDEYGQPPTKLQHMRLKHRLQTVTDPHSNYVFRHTLNTAVTAALLYEWRKYRQIYRFKKDTADVICQSDLASLPIDTLKRLPYPSLMLQCPDIIQLNAAGWKCDEILVTVAKDNLIIGTVKTNGKESWLEGATFMVPKGAHSAQDIVDATQDIIARQIHTTEMDKSDAMNAARENLFKNVLALLGYIASAPDDIVVKKPAQKGVTTAHTPKTTGIADNDTVSIVGETVVRRFIKSRDAYERQRVSETAQHHSTPAPHMRRAHYHHFWAGPLDGERKLICHWVAPTFVNAKLAETELPTTINIV